MGKHTKISSTSHERTITRHIRKKVFVFIRLKSKEKISAISSRKKYQISVAYVLYTEFSERCQTDCTSRQSSAEDDGINSAAHRYGSRHPAAARYQFVSELKKTLYYQQKCQNLYRSPPFKHCYGIRILFSHPLLWRSYDVDVSQTYGSETQVFNIHLQFPSFFSQG